MSYSLLSEPWVSVLEGGQSRDVSLRAALSRAHTCAGLALDDPLQAVAVLRQVLLPVLWSAVGVPRTEVEWAQWWRVGRFDSVKLAAYLDEHQDRFDLFDSQQPFAQVGGLRTVKDETKSISLLLASAATGNNVPVFSARTEGDPPPLSPAAAARALLAAHCWDTAAIKSGAVDDPEMKAGKTTGNPTGPVGALGVIVPLGATLFETLMLNTPIQTQGLRPDDRPQWARAVATPKWNRRPADGLLDLLTWQSRRIRLVPEVDEDGSTVVRQVVVAAGDRLDPLPENEPHTAWRQVDKPKSGEPRRRPVRHQPGRAAWRGLTTLLATRPEASTTESTLLLSQLAGLQVDDHLPRDLPLQLLTVGVVYGNQSAVVEDVMVDSLPLPVAALSPDSVVRQLLLDVADHADQLRDAANKLGDDIRLAAGGAKLPWDRSLRPGEGLINDFTPVVRRMLRGLQREPGRIDEADAAWRTAARAVAWAVAEKVIVAAAPTAFLGREKESPSMPSRARPAKPVVYRVSIAEERFRSKLNQILGPVETTGHPFADSGAAR